MVPISTSATTREEAPGNPAPRAEHRHAEGLTGRIESKAAFGVPPERQVELDPRVDPLIPSR